MAEGRMMYWGILIGLALCAGMVWFEINFILNSAAKRSAFTRCFEQNRMDWRQMMRLLVGGPPYPVGPPVAQEAEEEVKVEVTETAVDPEPVIEVQLPPPDRGNIRPIYGEEKEPDPLPEALHLFPWAPASETLFEEFNRRFFLHFPSGSSSLWPGTTLDDFPTKLYTRTDQLIELAHRHLRPGYPVIIDFYGWWKTASFRLEQDNNYIDPVVAAYLEIPADRRPAVISSPASGGVGSLLILRYGFEPYRIKREGMDPYLTESLKYLMAALIGARKEWMWFSVARMRKTVLASQAEKQREIAAITETERQAAQRRHANRFAALWDLPLVEKPEVLEAPVDEPMVDAEIVQSSDANPKRTISQSAKRTAGAGEPA